MKILLFDLLYAQPIGNVKFHGGGEYIKSVFQALAEYKNSDYKLEVCFNQSEFIDDWILSIIQKRKIIIHQVATVLEIINVIGKCADNNDVRFFTGMMYPYSKIEFPNSVMTFGVCHGLRGLEKPYDIAALRYISNFSDLKECISNTILWKRKRNNLVSYYSELFEKFDVVITDSEHSKYSIKLNFPEIVERKVIKVYYAPSKYIIAQSNDSKTESYIMMISANRWLKNCYRGAMAIDKLYQKGHLKGVKTYIYGNFPSRIRNKLKCIDRFVFYDYVSSEELEKAYQNCTVFFYPTLNEGFGLPPLEAMKYNRTCVISAVCSLQEIYGDSVYYCNPYDLMEMGNRILQAIENPISIKEIDVKVSEIRARQNHDLRDLCNLVLS